MMYHEAGSAADVLNSLPMLTICGIMLFQNNIFPMVAAMQVILLTDADVDGAHIRTLLLTFLFRYARDLFDKGHVYVGVPPLYKLEVGRSSQYLYSDAELAGRTQGLSQGSFTVQRFKVP